MIDTLVVYARGFKRHLLDHIEMGRKLEIGERSHAHLGCRAKAVILAGFSADHQPSEALMASIMPCLATSGSTSILFTQDGEKFTGMIESE